MTDEPAVETHTATLDLEVDEELVGSGVDGWLTVEILPPPETWALHGAVRPGLTDDELGAYADWVTRRLTHLRFDDGAEMDPWHEVLGTPAGRTFLGARWALDDLGWRTDLLGLAVDD